jgi:uncharacterized membrane protein HdeD (DUF308 family)
MKGVFYFLFGLMALMQTGTFSTLSVFFVILIMLIAILFLAVAFLVKDVKNKSLLIVSGLINLGFGIWLAFNYDGSIQVLLRIIVSWIVYSMLSDFIEAGIMFRQKNALGVLHLINGIIVLFFAYVTVHIFRDPTHQRLDYLGLMAFVIGLVSELTAFLFSKARDCSAEEE